MFSVFAGAIFAVLRRWWLSPAAVLFMLALLALAVLERVAFAMHPSHPDFRVAAVTLILIPPENNCLKPF